MTTTIETISPDTAKLYLGNNLTNRSVRFRVLNRYASQMKSGQWLLSGDSIKFGETGRLIDGQHRLMACVQSGQAFQTVVVRGVPDERQVFGVIDCGSSRSAGDTLQLNGITNSNNVAAAARVAIQCKAGKPFRLDVTNNQVLAFVESNPSIARSVRICKEIGLLMRPSTAAGLHFIFSEIDAELADDLVVKVGLGADLSANSPHYVLRRALEKGRSKLVSRIPHVAEAVFLIKTWNALREDRQVSILKWDPREPFTEIK